MKLEIKQEIYSSCECCGEMSTDVTYLDDAQIYVGDVTHYEPYYYICEQYNKGIKHFDIIEIEDKEGYYIQLNGKLFEGYVYWNILAEIFDKYDITHSAHEVNLDI